MMHGNTVAILVAVFAGLLSSVGVLLAAMRRGAGPS